MEADQTAERAMLDVECPGRSKVVCWSPFLPLRSFFLRSFLPDLESCQHYKGTRALTLTHIVGSCQSDTAKILLRTR